MNRFSLPAAMMALFCLHSGTAAAAYASDEVLSADIITAIIPLTAWGIAHYKDDGEGEGQFYRSVGVALVLNTTLRVAFNETSWGERPNGSPYGFPSGHVGFMTSNAAFLQDRFGWKFGVPAYLLTGYVAWVRVDSDHHRWRDVAAAAALSYGVSKLFVTPHNATHLAPIIGPDFMGMRWERSF
jgi:membrane-associated phospholipid phosphatase